MLMRLISFLLNIYALMQLVHFALPYVTNTQQPWMATLQRLCAPGAQLGSRVTARLLPDRRFKIDVGPVACAVICFLARMILNIFF